MIDYNLHPIQHLEKPTNIPYNNSYNRFNQTPSALNCTSSFYLICDQTQISHKKRQSNNKALFG